MEGYSAKLTCLVCKIVAKFGILVSHNLDPNEVMMVEDRSGCWILIKQLCLNI